MIKSDHFLVTNDVPYGSKQMIKDINELYIKNPISDSKFAMLGHEEGIVVFAKNLKEAELILYEIIGKFINLK